MKKRFLFKFFALLLCMLMGVVHGAKANRCFTQYWGVNTENISIIRPQLNRISHCSMFLFL